METVLRIEQLIQINNQTIEAMRKAERSKVKYASKKSGQRRQRQ